MLVHQDRLLRLAQTALADGASRPSLTRIVWRSLAGQCENPHTVELRSRPPERRDLLVVNADLVSSRASEKYIGIDRSTMVPLTVEMEVPCRKCPNCLARRRASWAYRARAELALSTRTWFGTFTLRPEEQYRATCQAIADARARCVEWDTLAPHEQFLRRHNVIAREITRYLKRVRKESGAKLRYLFVAEAHRSGDPHYHALIHEWGRSVPKRLLESQWKLGFSGFRLVTDTRQATYLCKYLSKDSRTRVRASVSYGRYTLGKPPNAPRALDYRPHATAPYERLGQTAEVTGENAQDAEDGPHQPNQQSVKLAGLSEPVGTGIGHGRN